MLHIIIFLFPFWIMLLKFWIICNIPFGEMAERFKAHAWKVCVPSQVPWVRIPLSPPLIGSWSKIIMLSSNKNNILLVSILFVLIGIFLRIYQLNFENYWLDEMLSFWVADPNLSLEDTFTRNYYIGQTPPPFDLFLKKYLEFFSYIYYY